MPARKPTTEKTPTDKVELALRAIERAVGQLVHLTGDEDREVVRRSIVALDVLGPRAILGPLADGLNRASSPEHRAILITSLVHYDKESSSRSTAALLKAARKEEDPQIAALIQRAMIILTGRDVASQFAAWAPAKTGEADGLAIECGVEPSRSIDVTPSDHPDESPGWSGGTTRLEARPSRRRSPNVSESPGKTCAEDEK